MHRLKLITFTIISLFFFQYLSAQNSFNTDLVASSTDLKELPSQDWSFYADEENNVFYIDFESIPVNLADIVVKSETGEVVLKDKLFDLPVNAIYEIDASSYQEGKYHIELRSYTGVIRKEIEVR